jgi:hypothetical protein
MIWRRSPEAVEAAGRLAFASGYRTGFNNAGRAVETLLADRLGAVRAQVTGIDNPVVPCGVRGWRRRRFRRRAIYLAPPRCLPNGWDSRRWCRAGGRAG